MNIPEGFNYSDYCSEPSLEMFFKEFIKEIEVDDYITITKLMHYKDKDVAILTIRGKDPMLSALRKCQLDTRLLKPIKEVIDGKVSFNFDIVNEELYLPESVASEGFAFTAPHDEQFIGNDIAATSSTPVEILWRLIRDDYAIIFDNCAPVPCHKMYFGLDNFSIHIDYINEFGETKSKCLMMLDDGVYKYQPFNIVYIGKESLAYMDSIINSMEYVTVVDDLGRKRLGKRVDIQKYERNIYNTYRFNKNYDESFTFSVLGRMYNLAMYLDGLGLILTDLGVTCPKFSLPHRPKQSFSVSSDKQNNSFSMQVMEYDTSIVEEVLKVYMNHKEEMSKYLKFKDEEDRAEMLDIFSKQCNKKYGKLLHYYVNGIFDALAIQKGDVNTRAKILKGYYETVHKEFLMYACYYYDIRTAFLRNNFRIEREFNSTFIHNKYDGRYFLVG